MQQAESGVEELQGHVDTLIVIPNQNLFRLANEKTTFTDAFALADDVLYQGVKGVTDLMVRPGIINLDFADVRSVMNEMGKAMMGTGEAAGEERAVQAAEKAIANPLLDEISLKGAKGVLINVTAGPDLTLFELDEAANRIRTEVDPDANIMVGSTLDPEMDGTMRVSVVATGIDAEARVSDIPEPHRTLSEPIADTSIGFDEPNPNEVNIEPASATSFADRQIESTARVEIAPEPTSGDQLDQPSKIQRTAPYGQPKISAASDEQEHRAGDPTPDALRRLQRAVQNVPKATPMSPSAAPVDEERNSRMTINSLIHRMTGQVGRDEPAPRATDKPGLSARSEASDDMEDQDRERVDIPAFLRRQAN